jgi:DNA polymerase-4
VAEDLRIRGYVGRIVGIKLRFADFHTLTRDRSLAEPTADAEVIAQAALECLRRVALDRRVRLLGVRITELALAASSPFAADLYAAEQTPGALANL